MLSDFEIEDKWTENCQFPKVIKRLYHSNNEDYPSNELERGIKNLLYLQLTGDKNLIKVHMNLESLEILINSRWLKRIFKCFTPLNEINSAKQVHGSLLNQLFTIRKEGISQLHYALENSKQIQLDINIFSPKLTLIEEASDPTTAMMTIEASKLYIYDNNENFDSKSLGVSWQEHLYQEFRIKLYEFRLNIISSADGILQNKKARIIPFCENCDGEFSVEILRGNAGFLPKIRVSALIPNFRVFLSGLILRDFVRIMLALVEDDIPINLSPLIDPIDIKDPCVENEILNQFSDCNIQPKDYLLLNTRIFELHLAFTTANATLLRDTIEPDGKMVVVGRLIVEGLIFQYQYRNLDMSLYFAVHSAFIEDKFQDHGERFQFLASTVPEGSQFGHYDLDPASTLEENKKIEASPLISFYYERKAPRAPDYKKIQQELYVAIHQIYLNFNMKTFAALYEFVNVGLLSDGKHKKQRQILRLKRNGMKVNLTKGEIETLAKIDSSYKILLEDSTTYLSDEEEGREDLSKKRKPPAEEIFLHVSVGIERGTVVFNRDGHNYAVLGICKSDIDVFQKDDYLDIRCSFPSILLEGLQEKYYRNILSSVNFTSPLFIVYRRYLRKYANYPGYLHKLIIRPSSVTLTVLQRFWFDFFNYLGNLGDYYKKLKQSSVLQTEAEEKEKNPQILAENHLLYEFQLNETFLRIPRNSMNSEFVQIEFYEGIMKNDVFIMYEDHENIFYGEKFSLISSCIAASVGETNDDYCYPSAEKTELIAEYERALTDTSFGELPFIPFKISATIPSIHVKASEHHYGIIVSTLMQGFDEYFLRSEPKNNKTYLKDNFDDVGENKESLQLNSNDDNHEKSDNEESNDDDDDDENTSSVTKLDTTLVISFTLESLYAEIIKEYDSDEDASDEEDDNDDDDDDKFSSDEEENDIEDEVDKYEESKKQNSDDVYYVKTEETTDSDNSLASFSDFDLSDDSSENSRKYLSQAIGILDNLKFTWISTKKKGLRMQISVDDVEVVDSRTPKKNKFPQLWTHPELDDTPHIRYEYVGDGKGHTKMSVLINQPEILFIPLTYRVVAFFFTNPYVNISLPKELVTSITGEETETLHNPPLHFLPSKNNKTPNTKFLFYSKDYKANLSVSCLFKKGIVLFPTKWTNKHSRGAIIDGDLSIQVKSFRDIFGIAISLHKMNGKVCYLRKRFEQNEYLIQDVTIDYINTNVSNIVELTLHIDSISIRSTLRDVLCILGVIPCITPPDIRRDKHISGTVHSENENISNIYHSMDIRTGGLSITIIDDNQANMPIFNVRIYAFTVDRQHGINGDSNVAIKIQCDSYNRYLATWEPIIEPWENITSVNITPIYNSMPPKSLTKITFYSEEICNINFSQHFYMLIQAALKRWNNPLYLNYKQQTDYSNTNNLLILNYTGMNITIFHNDGCNDLSISDHLVLNNQKDSSISVKLHGGWRKINNLPTNSIGKWIIGLHPHSSNCSPCLLWQIKQKSSNERIITISSNVFIKNHCSEDILIRIHLEKRGDIDFVLESNKSNPIPLQFAKSSKIFIRPATLKDNHYSYDWSLRSVDCMMLSEKSGLIQCPNKNSNQSPYYYLFSVDKSVYNGRQVIHFLPPIILENLLTHDLYLNIWKFDTDIKTLDKRKIEKGKKLQIFHHEKCTDMEISFSFGEFSECTRTHLIRSRTDDTFPTFWFMDDCDRPLLICSKKELDKNGREIVMIYASYWMVNKTGLPLFYKRKAFRGHSKGKFAPGQDIEDMKEVKSINSLDQNTSDQSTWYDDKNNKKEDDNEGNSSDDDDDTDDDSYEDEDKVEKAVEKEEPLMFSYASLDLFKPRTSIKIANSKWSKAVGLESVGTSGEVIANDKQTSIQYHIGVSIELLSERYFRTKVITFRPRYILVNRTSRDIYYKQENTDFCHLLKTKQNLPFHWLDRSKPLLLAITLSKSHKWTGGFQIDEIGEFAIKIRSNEENKKENENHDEKSSLSSSSSSNLSLNPNSIYLARIEIQLQKATFFIIFKKQANKVPPYQLENYTDLEIYYYQKISGAEKQTLGAKSSVPYTWDNANGVHKLVIEIPKINYQKIIKMDKIKSNKTEKITVQLDNKEITYLGQVIAKGPTRILRICQMEEKSSTNDNENNNNQQKQLKLKQGEIDLDPTVTFQLFVNFKGLGISFIDSKPQEIIYISLLGVQAEYANSERHQSFEITLDDFQVDNQLDNATYPVLLSQSKKKQTFDQNNNNNQENLDPDNSYQAEESRASSSSSKNFMESKFFHFCVILSNFYTSINYFHYISFLLQELHLRVDDKVINRLLDFFGWEIGAIHKSNFEIENEDLLSEPDKSFKKLYVALLHINPMKCNITLRYTEEDYEDKLTNHRNHVKTYLSTVRATVSNIENAPLSLGSLLLENIFNTRPELISRISKHYKQQVIWDIHKIIGSFDLIGNPVNLVTNLGNGVHDFFYEPIHGFVTSPRDFLDGLHKGSSSLAKNSVSGIFNTISELTGTLSRGVAHLTFDKDYIRQRQKDQVDVPRNPARGFGKGMKEFGKGCYKGLTGIVRTPYTETKENGPIGLITGTGKGLVGAVVKPTVGFVDIAVRTTQGVKNLVEFGSKFNRIRPPRAFGPDRSIRMYDVNLAVGQIILKTISSGIYSENWYICHCFTCSPLGIVIISNQNILFIDCNRDPFVSWQSSLMAIDHVDELHNSVIISFHKIDDTFTGFSSDAKQKRLSMVQFDFSDHDVSHCFYEKLSAIIRLIHRFELHETDIVFSNKFIL